MSDWNQKQEGQDQNYGKGSGEQGQGGSGAWVWLRWKDNAPQNVRQGLSNSGFKSWHCNTGEWNCKVWVPATNEAEAKKYFESKIENKEHIQETKFEWNWNQSSAA